MKKTIFFFLFAQSLSLAVFSQYWQQQVNYTIDVSLNDKENTLDAFEKIEYINNSPDTLKFIWFHLWPNAYKNDKTAFSDKLLLNGKTRFYFSDKEERGYINRLDFKINNLTAPIEDHPQYIDVIKVILPAPLPPKQKIVITTPFHEKLPFNFSRGGHDGESYQVSQWFPKPAVYDKNGWHPMPYLDQGEFYGEFGNFDVRITVPKNYAIAATGELQNKDEISWLASRKNFSWEPPKEKIKSKSGIIKKVIQKFPTSSSETKTLQYLQNNVHDFAWFADKRFIVNHDTCRLASGRVIDVFAYYTTQEKEIWKSSIQYCKKAIGSYSSQVGEYPYNIVSVVQGPESFGGGMEYPTITVISPTHSTTDLDITIAHEVGHNWFYGVLATNERDHPWMDEGINSFYEHRYALAYYQKISFQERTFFETCAAEKKDQPIETPSETFSDANYNLVAYYKTSEWLRWLEQQLGKEKFDKAMQEYYRRWQFKHPQPEDFKKTLEESIGKKLDSAFLLLNKKGILPNQQLLGTKVTTIFKRHYSDFLNNKNQNLITIGPALGVNSYDKFMAGVFVTNLKLPLNRFKFFIAPLYSTGARKFLGLGKIDYTFYPNKVFHKIDIFLNTSSFSVNTFADTAGRNYLLGFQKFVPGFRLTLNEKDPRSTLHRYIQWKTFFIDEDALHFSRDTIIRGPDTSIVSRIIKNRENRTLNQLQFVIENFRALYPYRGELQAEQPNNFIKLSFTGNYFFNYPKGVGLDLRFFEGIFFYVGSQTILKQFETDRYHLNLSGSNGYEDYTYSDYFIGRNKFEHFASQQIMMRDGGFKVTTELLAAKVGKTDNWLMAANFNSTIPAAINPLSLLPFKIPIKFFFDIGTFAEAWQQKSNSDHFLFDGGLQISALKNTVNVYLPFIYSKVFRDYIQSALEKRNRFLKTITFSIDISNFNWKKIDRNLPF